MARPSYDAVAPAPGAPSRSRATRVAAAAAVMVLACTAVVALVGMSTEQQRGASLLAMTPSQTLDHLALMFLRHGATMSVKDMEAKLDAWHNNPSTLLDADQHVQGMRTQMLALGPKSKGDTFSTALEGEGGTSVCLLYTSPSPRDATLSRMPSSA